MVYTAEQDPLCYPGTTVLINKLDLVDQAELDEAELALFLIRADEPLPDGALDRAHYMAIHHHLFQDIYDWAGQPRTIRIGKGGNWFCYPEYIDRQMDLVFAKLERNGFLTGLSPEEFARQATDFLADLNAIHPFREGNGRTQLTFLSLLAENGGLPFNDDLLDRHRVIGAMIDSFDGRIEPLRQLILDLVSH
ncbi:adenosine monophosphate-protein transferase [Rhizobium rhizosphaerae]|uniref:protein adenylyltransferase n=1 Tax=Xaviernesmea rhizosphaerae TaxID=1672749 RepID=A0A1Q9AQI5_9HYPH|nr:Fic family protein [Xaviernesmea rhizosphaerae]OLP57674.1 adenosine monophosphate-protein transferase [Xaviernesmea rhizosphaerae]